MCCEAASRFVKLPQRDSHHRALAGTSVPFPIHGCFYNAVFSDFCLVCFQFSLPNLSLPLPLCRPTRPWIWVRESAMHTNEIICCDWGLDVAAAESNLQFLGGEKKAHVCVVFPKALVYSFMTTNSSVPFPQTLNLFCTQAPESGVPYDNVPQSDWIWYEDCYVWWKVLFIVASNTTDLFCCCSSEME